jgi:hypothetical protein
LRAQCRFIDQAEWREFKANDRGANRVIRKIPLEDAIPVRSTGDMLMWR